MSSLTWSRLNYRPMPPEGLAASSGFCSRCAFSAGQAVDIDLRTRPVVTERVVVVGDVEVELRQRVAGLHRAEGRDLFSPLIERVVVRRRARRLTRILGDAALLGTAGDHVAITLLLVRVEN